MKLRSLKFIFFTKFKIDRYFKLCTLNTLFVLIIFVIFLNACSSIVSLNIVRKPIKKIENIKFVEVGNFEFVEGQINLPNSTEFKAAKSYIREKNLLKPPIINFASKKNLSLQIKDLVRASLVHELSLHSPYRLINTTGKEKGYSGVSPNLDEVAILNGKIKYFEIKIESKEDLSYFTNVKNRGITLEQSILVSTIAMGAEASGVGFSVATPYVEIIAALEVEFSLLRKSNGSNIIKPQIFHSYFAKKWGGSPQTSHLPKKLKKIINKKNKKDEFSSESILSKVDQAGLSFTNPTEYFARGFNLKQSKSVPHTSLDTMIKLSRNVSEKFMKQISPYHEESELVIKDGNKAASILIKGNAFQEAISILKGLEKRNPEDEYNLGLAFEAIGEIRQAGNHYSNALKNDPSEEDYKQAVNRTIN